MRPRAPRAVAPRHAAPCTSTALLADYPALEVWDTPELDTFGDQLKAERERLSEVFRIAKEEKRKVIWKNAQFDMKKVDRIEGWIKEIRKDERRAW